MRKLILAIPMAAALAGGALAQTTTPTGARPGNVIGTGMSEPRSDRASNLPGSPIRSTIAPNLPSPAVPQDNPSDFVQAAINALASGATGKAQQSMEMAQTRLLSRSVPMGQTGVPDTSPVVAQISQALRELGAGNKAGSMNTLQSALATLKAAGV
ncbi:hypothetical protein [Rhodopila sp.]|uniref:hypothetical protein n=1 Tax=Rhodopila sp. TaxID=2480087 RepID=UPI002C770755|nr:hypothetical protein [Rhodopila sp.]HVZ09468.1 hypothetical protein [Rhodopila sp.]